MGTAFITPIRFSVLTGHWRSSFANRALDQSGAPLPWYTYAAIDFLSRRNFEGKRVLEFGSGQSTLWWSARAAQVTAFEGNAEWLDRVRASAAAHVTLHHVPSDDPKRCVDAVEQLLPSDAQFDVVIVDGLWRTELVAVAFAHLAPGGLVICDNSEGYSFFEAGRGKAEHRIDFYGFAPGGVMETCTSLFFSAGCDTTSTNYPITLPRGREKEAISN